jgi:two-component sensor histidine kinase
MKGMLRESEARIRSMGLIHEKLYQSRSLSSVNFGSYVETLASQLVRMHAVGDQPPELEVNIDDIDLPLDTAMPCGLIINELVSNSLKYAFVDRPEGRIVIDVHREGEREYRLRVSDNGVGMKLPQKGERRSSLGLNLIEMLVDQLNGSLEYKNGDGITADIRFHEVVYQSRV